MWHRKCQKWFLLTLEDSIHLKVSGPKIKFQIYQNLKMFRQQYLFADQKTFLE